jgi:hypothetical protein
MLECRMGIADHFLFGITLGSTQLTSLAATPSGGGSVNRQPQKGRVVEGFIVLGATQAVEQCGPHASKIQALGEITQSIISETLIHAQSPARRRAH